MDEPFDSQMGPQDGLAGSPQGMTLASASTQHCSVFPTAWLLLPMLTPSSPGLTFCDPRAATSTGRKCTTPSSSDSEASAPSLRWHETS